MSVHNPLGVLNCSVYSMSFLPISLQRLETSTATNIRPANDSGRQPSANAPADSHPGQGEPPEAKGSGSVGGLLTFHSVLGKQTAPQSVLSTGATSETF